MGGEEDRAAVVAMLAHHGFEGMRSNGIESDKGLVHDDKLRVVQPSRNDCELLLHAVGIGAHGLRQIPGKPESVGVFCDALVALVLAHAVDIGDEV